MFDVEQRSTFTPAPAASSMVNVEAQEDQRHSASEHEKRLFPKADADEKAMFEHLEEEQKEETAEEEVHVSPEEIEAEVKRQLDEKLVHLTAEKDEIN